MKGNLSLRTWGLVTAIVLVLVALLPAVVGLFGGGSSRSFAQLAAGDCVKLSPLSKGSPGTARASVELVHQKVPCDAAGSISYLIGTIGPGSQSCPNAFYLDYFTTGVDNPENLPREFTACLIPNFTPGICVSDDGETLAYKASDCTPNALFRVAEVHDVDDPEVCTGDTRPMEFPIPARTYCLLEVR